MNKLCQWCKRRDADISIKGYFFCTVCYESCGFRRKAYANQRLTVPRVPGNDCSNNCDIGYHERCFEKDCPCACHQKEKV